MTHTLDGIDGIIRFETHPRPIVTPIVLDRIRSVYPHEQIYGEFCNVQGYVAAPPDDVYEWLSYTRSLEEWSYSLRDFSPTGEPGLWQGVDRLGGDTKCFVRTESNPQVRTVDYHCAWDQGDHLWMIYLMRVVDAQIVFDKPGSVVLWTNCKHPFYEANPFESTAPEDRPVWVGDFWDIFSAGHQLELDNLAAIAAARHAAGTSITPEWMRGDQR